MTQSLEREALELATILDTMADGVFVIDTEFVIQRWNRAMERITGYAPEQAIGRNCAFLNANTIDQHLYSLPPLTCDLFKVDWVDKVETVIKHCNGDEVHVIVAGRVLRGDDGEPMGAVISLTDITSLRRLETEMNQLRREVTGRFEFDNIVGKSPQMREVFNLVELAAASPVTVLITGETGTGKEVVAKAIHYHSERKNGPLVRVNCSALSESLLESELFGHAKGAFTGAIKDHVGRFERANEGTIFLDEVGDIPPLVQVKLLRVLQERELERVGESIPRKVDVRVIAATHRNLRDLVRRGEFREDLFYRLKVFPLHLPPLRERKEDIDPLVKRFIAQFNADTGKNILGLTPDALRMVLDYCWPGNVRELENAIEHAFVTCSGAFINPLDLPIEIRRVELKLQLCDDPSQADAFASPGLYSEFPARRKRGNTREELMAVLEVSGWNKAEAARRLGITRTSVWRRMKKLGVPLERPTGPSRQDIGSGMPHTL
ncbi:MAG TPA: sigma 54-interacting transcriptional regulator [Candidatus Hydrogenedentes bacterium]|jgi:PAS domain S-box-containing protein|nr:sigma 54-interacting transcriptional regulator [Candidatus Hydrogenedentota bacterium]